MWKKGLTVIIAALLLVVGCGKKEPFEKKQEIKQTDNGKEFPYQFPLTGMGSSQEVNGRAVAVMVNNHPKARPQSGLNKADIVYEVLAEGNITRFLAIFQSEQPEKVGPIRSARDYFIQLAKGYDSLYVCHGNSPDAAKLLNSGYIDALNGLYYDGTLFKRASFRKAPHNSYITFDNIKEGAKEKGYNMEQAPNSLTFLSKEEAKKVAGEKAVNISISYFDDSFNSSFQYDEKSQKYTRYINGEKMIDFESNEPISVDNLFIVEAEHNIIDSHGRRTIDFTNGGNAYLIQKGKMREVEWKNIDGRILPFQDGKEVGFVQGKTWINVIPTTPGLEKAISFE